MVQNMPHTLKTDVSPLPPGADISGAVHLMLKRHQSSLSLSNFSTPVGKLVAPGNAFVSQGLWVWDGWQPLKYLDTWAFGLSGTEGPLPLQLESAWSTPSEMAFVFVGPSARMSLEFYLLNLECRGAAGCIKLGLDVPGGYNLTVEPLLDISTTGCQIWGEYWCHDIRGAITAGIDDATVSMGFPKNEISINPRKIEREYPLGAGELRRSGAGAVPLAEIREVYSPGVLSVPAEDTTMLFSAAPTPGESLELLAEAGKFDANREREYGLVEEAIAGLKPYGLPESKRKAVLARAIAMLKFGVLTPKGFFYDYGGFWKRGIGFDDAMEGLYHNVGTFYRTGFERWLPDMLDRALQMRDTCGRLPAGIGADGNPWYSGIWGALFALCVGNRLMDIPWPIGLNEEMLNLLCQVISTSGGQPDGNADMADSVSPEEEDCGISVGEDGLIRCAPHHGWANGMRHVGGYLLPQRIPLEWEEDMIAMGEPMRANEPAYLLCEVNALWLRALNAGVDIARDAVDENAGEIIEDTLLRATKAYRPVFWDDDAGLIRHAVTEFDGVTIHGSSPTAYGVQSAALLQNDCVFSESELSRIMRGAKKHLVVLKDWKVFGLRVMADEQGMYLNEDQSQQGVCLPRLTPYILSLAHRLGMEEFVDEMLTANLEHQMAEGCLFYNNDIFSTAGNIAPAGNPSCWCSQWVDPYLAYLQAGR